ncbi:MAG: hypothetical protein ABI579_09750 [Candidatus Sumerlaeota bacterium]
MLSRLLLAFLLTFPNVIYAQMATPPALNTALQTSTVGSVVSLGFSSVSNTHLLNLATHIPDAGGALLYSDCPETITSLGRLYQDVLPAGSNRIYLYHVNGMGAGSQLRVSAVLSNIGATTETATITRRSFPNPSGNYSAIGREGVRQYYENAAISNLKELAPGESALVDAALDSQLVANNQLVNATFDATFSGSLQVTIVAMANGADTLATFAGTAQSPNDAFLRQGAFLSNTRENTTPYTYKTSDGIKRLRFADGPNVNADPPINGSDNETNAIVTLKGNFAVTYKVRIGVRSDDGRRLSLLLNPRAGAYGGYFRVTVPETGGAITAGLIPSAVASVSDNSQGAVISLQTLPATSQTMLIEFTPAGATSLPFEILLVPFTAAATPTSSPTASPSATVSLSPTASLTATPSGTASPTASLTSSPSQSPSPTDSLTPSLTAFPSPKAQTSFTVY